MSLTQMQPLRRTLKGGNKNVEGNQSRRRTQQADFETISAHRVSDHSMKRTYFPGITDIVVVTDPAEIRTISNDSRFDRDFIGHGPVRNVQLLRKMLRIFSLNGRRFPTIAAAHRSQPSRRARRTVVETKRQGRRGETRTRSIGAPGRMGQRDRNCGEARSACAADHRKIVRGNVHGH